MKGGGKTDIHGPSVKSSKMKPMNIGSIRYIQQPYQHVKINSNWYTASASSLCQSSKTLYMTKKNSDHYQGGLEPSLTEGDLGTTLPSVPNLETLLTLLGVARAGLAPR